MESEVVKIRGRLSDEGPVKASAAAEVVPRPRKELVLGSCQLPLVISTFGGVVPSAEIALSIAGLMLRADVAFLLMVLDT